MRDNLKIKELLKKNGKDYTYAVIFFLIFSFFLFFVIRPNIILIFKANSEIENLKRVDNFYEVKIQKIIELQQIIEENRDDFRLLNKAITRKPEVNKVLFDLTQLIEKNKLIINKINVIDINLKSNFLLSQLKKVSFKMELTGSFNDFNNFIKEIHRQRRAKTVKNILINKKEQESSESASLIFDLEVEGYYL
ncbi:MAG: type 4a pilus biogenesis protein PilO [Patescibacteria group bacterium]|nr:type 4a pilus biogenesis protein PilO [Patescibacteria group bacterium]